MIYVRQASHRARPGRRKLFAAGATALILASLTIGIAAATPSSFLELDGNVISNGTGTYDWANSGALTTTGGTYSRAGTGGIFNGGHFNGNTTPPTAPTRTAAALADATIADAEFKVDPLSVDVTSCGTGDPTAYTGAGGETNGDLLSSDTFGTAAVPNKDDLSNVYAVAHLTGAVNEVFFGAERVINNGDSHIDFEFLQSAVTIPNACSGSFAGHRTQGDFLLSVDFTNGGTLGGTILYQWHCNADPGAQPADGTVCDPPAHGKSTRHYQIVGSTAVVIKVNDALVGTIGCGGWVCRNADGTPTTTIAQNELMEGGIDLAQLGFSGCISTFLPHTRSSQSFTATLKDFEIIPFNTCVTPSVTTQLKLADGSNVSGDQPVGSVVHDTATLHGQTADAGGTVTYRLYTDNTCTTLSTTPALNSTKTVVNGVVPDSDPVTFTTAGNFWFQATYSGDSPPGRNQGPVKSDCTTEPITTVLFHPSIATVIKDANGDPITNPLTIPQTLHDSATLTNASATAGGTVRYRLYTNNDCSTLSTTPALDSTVTVTNGVVPDSTAVTFSAAGNWWFQAVYSGDSFNVGTTSACTSEPLVISPRQPSINTVIKTTADVAIVNPVTIPTTVHDTATLTGATSDAGGTVRYRLYTNNDCSTLSTTPALDSTVTVTNGVVPNSANVTFTTAGNWWFQAVYSGDANNLTTTSACTSEPIVVSPRQPSINTVIKTTADVAIVNPVTIPTTVHDTATLTGATSDAGGTVRYRLYTNNDCSTLSTTPALDSTVTVTNGVVPNSANVTFTTAGNWWFQAVYSGDANNLTTTSACTSEPIVVSPNRPAPHSTPVVQIKDTLTVTGLTGNATGNVLVGLYSNATCATQIGSNASFPANTNVGGTLTAETSFVVVTSGTYFYKISYAGDVNNTGFSDCGTESVDVTITSLP